MDEAIDELKRLVFDEKRLVTAQYLLRHTALNAIEVQTLLWKFIDDHSTANPELNGTYRIFGAVSDEYPFSGVPRKRTTICRQDDLNKTKLNFISLDSVDVFSVQAKQVKSMYELWEADQEDWRTCRRDDVIENLLEKSIVVNDIARDCYYRYKMKVEGVGKKPKAAKSQDEEKPKKLASAKTEIRTSPDEVESCSKAIEKQIVLDDDDFCQGDDDEMEVDEDHIFDGEEKKQREISYAQKGTKSPVANGKSKKAKKGIEIESEDEDEGYDEEEQQPPRKQLKKQSAVSKQETVKPKKGKKATKSKPLLIIGSDDDLENDEEMNNGTTNDGTTHSQGISFHREKVQERYIDDDGMEVVRTITVDVENEQKPAKTDGNAKKHKSPLKHSGDTDSQPTATDGKKATNGGTKRATAPKRRQLEGQQKISSFFMKL